MTATSSRIPDDLHWAMWLDSMEGVPDSADVAVFPVEQAGYGWLRGRLYATFDWLGEISPGVGLALALAFFGKALSSWLGESLLGFEKSPISAVLLAIALGLLIRNQIGLPAAFGKGLRLCMRLILRAGIVLLGLRASLLVVGEIGLANLPVIVGCIGAALVAVIWINRAFGLPRRLGSLIAVGTSICGVSAIVATGPVIEAEEDEISYAVTCVTLFGTLALFCYPFLAHWLFAGNPHLAGLFLGTAIHDTTQATGGGLMYQEQFGAEDALTTAMVTKIVRNLFMIAVIPLMAILYHRHDRSTGYTRQSWHKMVPLFVFGFLAMAAIRSIGDIGEHPFLILSTESWTSTLSASEKASGWCLTMAMAAVGLVLQR